MKRSQNRHRITFRENVIHVGAGFVAKERPHVVAGVVDARAASRAVGSE